MTAREAFQEAEQRIQKYLGRAWGALGRAELIARAAGLDWIKPEDLSRLQEQIRSLSGTRLFGGITERKTHAPRELRWALHDDMTPLERLFGRAGRLRHWRARRRERARLARERARMTP